LFDCVFPAVLIEGGDTDLLQVVIAVYAPVSFARGV
jgi:hypothetical protein